MVKNNPEISSPFSSKDRLNDLYSNSLLDQFFSVLLNSIDKKDFLVLVIGGKGSGKTSLMLKLITQLKQKVKSCQIKIKSNENGNSNRHTYPGFLYKSNNRKVIILDDAHSLNYNELAIIFKTAWDSTQNSNQIILFCESLINTTIASLLKKMPKKASVNKLYIPPFDNNQTKLYLKYLLKTANFSGKFPFSEKDLEAIYKKSKGFPGIINKEADIIYSNKNYQSKNNKKSKSKFNKLIFLPITGLIVLIVTFVIIFNKPHPVPISDTKISQDSKQIIKKKISTIVPDNTKLSSPNITTKPLLVNKTNDEIITKPAIKKPSITESTIIESSITETDININESNPTTMTKTDSFKIPEKKLIPKPTPEGIDDLPQRVFQKDWIMAQNPEKFTIQIMAVKEKDAIDRFLKLSINNKNIMAYYKMDLNGDIWYKFISGRYNTIKEARKARETLSDKLKNLGPFPRQFSSVQNDIINFNTNK